MALIYTMCFVYYVYRVINQKLKEQGHAEKTFKNVDEAMQAYYIHVLTGEQLNSMPPEPLSSTTSSDDISAKY